MADPQFQPRDLHVHRWMPAGEPRAALLVVHGMAEHGARYGRLAETLNAKGFAVHALDLPGHGRSVADASELGHFADRDGWAHTLGAIARVHDQVEVAHRGLPLFMLGHSLGSFLLQDYVLRHGQRLAGAIFSATSGDLGALRRVAIALLSVEATLRGRRHRSALAERLSFTEFNRAFRPNRTASDWLSRDPAEVDKYVADPLCGFRCSTGLWLDLLQAAPSLRDQERLSRLPKNLPVLLISGGDDPVTRGDAGPKELQRLYRAAGVQDVEHLGYAGARHELLNETCRDLVTTDLVNWLERRR